MRTDHQQSQNKYLLDGDDLLDLAETGTILRASRSTVFRLIRDKELASIRVGKQRLVRRGAITEFITKREHAPAS